MLEDTYRYRLVYVLKYTRYWECSCIGCKRRATTENIEVKGPIESLSVTGAHPHPPNDLKHKICAAENKLKKVVSSVCNVV